MFAAVKGEIEQLDRLINDIAAVTVAEREDFSVQLHPVPSPCSSRAPRPSLVHVLGDHPFDRAAGCQMCGSGAIPSVSARYCAICSTMPPSTRRPARPSSCAPIGRDTQVRIEVADRWTWARPPRMST